MSEAALPRIGGRRGLRFVTSDARELLAELRALEPERAQDVVQALEARADRFTRQAQIRFGLLCAALIVLYWAGAYVVKRATPHDESTHKRRPRFPRPRPVRGAS
ncbi:MAG TPA: hypothetical protein VM686_37045 [Polyangiaceae bacterium]|jgi:hypothetical protein|nr:hypothetical protein [Polyangiaceae bacterium]